MWTKETLKRNGLYVAQGRNGHWYLSTGHEPISGEQIPMDADDEFLLSRESEGHAYAVLADWKAADPTL